MLHLIKKNQNDIIAPNINILNKATKIKIN